MSISILSLVSALSREKLALMLSRLKPLSPDWIGLLDRAAEPRTLLAVYGRTLSLWFLMVGNDNAKCGQGPFHAAKISLSD
jgi:hypothetical protein